MKHVILSLAVMICITIGTAAGLKMKMDAIKASDEYARHHVAMISIYGQKDAGTCTAVDVIAPSGKVYLLTAAHCRLMRLRTGMKTYMVEREGRISKSKIIAIDTDADLMLMESDAKTGLDIAKYTRLHEKVHTMTHGGGHASYRTDGELLEDAPITYGLFIIKDEAMEAQCKVGKAYTAQDVLFGRMCILSIINTLSTARAIPGSSGGPVMNAAGELVGIVSGKDEDDISGFVRLSDIKRFMEKR